MPNRSDKSKELLVFIGPREAQIAGLARLLIERLPPLCTRVRTHTTRKPTHDAQYFLHEFVTDEVFDHMIAKNEFIEHVEHGPYRYGLSRREMSWLEGPLVGLTGMTEAGVMAVQKAGYNATAVHIALTPPRPRVRDVEDIQKSNETVPMVMDHQHRIYYTPGDPHRTEVALEELTALIEHYFYRPIPRR